VSLLVDQASARAELGPQRRARRFRRRRSARRTRRARRGEPARRVGQAPEPAIRRAML
jgi:hypothetical protein